MHLYFSCWLRNRSQTISKRFRVVCHTSSFNSSEIFYGRIEPLLNGMCTQELLLQSIYQTREKITGATYVLDYGRYPGRVRVPTYILFNSSTLYMQVSFHCGTQSFLLELKRMIVKNTYTVEYTCS